MEQFFYPKSVAVFGDHPEIINVDINPLIVLEAGKGCLAVDAKIEYRPLS